MKYLKLITILLTVSTAFSQTVFVEPEIGFYKPSDKEHSFDYSLRYGGNAGIRLNGDIDLYGGFKSWNNETPSNIKSLIITSTINSIVLGTRKTFINPNMKYEIRIGAEYLFSFLNEEQKISDINSLWEFKGNGSSIALEGGVIFEYNPYISFFGGLNYIFGSLKLKEIIIDGDSYTPDEHDLTDEDTNIKMNGFNLKVSVMFSLFNL
ncbi:hypothetical protein ACFL5D_02745 [Candidatus Neomarinimicrobiota bacterium]